MDNQELAKNAVKAVKSGLVCNGICENIEYETLYYLVFTDYMPSDFSKAIKNITEYHYLTDTSKMELIQYIIKQRG